MLKNLSVSLFLALTNSLKKITLFYLEFLYILSQTLKSISISCISQKSNPSLMPNGTAGSKYQVCDKGLFE